MKSISKSISWRLKTISLSFLLITNIFIVEIIINLKKIFKKNFSSKFVKINFISFDVKFNEFNQWIDELFLTYYQRVIIIMQKIKIKNRIVNINIVSLNLLKSIILNIIIKVFIKSLMNNNVRRETTRKLTFINRLLKFVYNLTKKTRRIKLKIKKFLNKNFKNKKLKFYRDLMQKIISKTQLNFMITSY